MYVQKLCNESTTSNKWLAAIRHEVCLTVSGVKRTILGPNLNYAFVNTSIMNRKMCV